MAKCALCGAKIGRNTHSREHVFPEWLEKLFVPEGEDETIPYVRRSQVRNEAMERQEWKDIPFNMRVKALCKPCNEEWCNEIETEAKPSLIPMICNQPFTLDAPTQTSLAIWATKTLLMLQLTHAKKRRSVADDSFRWFREHRWPLPNEQVWIGRYDGTGDWPVSYRHYGMLINQKGAVPSPPDHVNAHISAVGVGHLVCLLFGHVIDGGPSIKPKAGTLAAALRPIWPALGGSVAFPPAKTVEGNTGLDRLVSTLGDADAFHQGKPQVPPNI
jgi:hypothetical protein